MPTRKWMVGIGSAVLVLTIAGARLDAAPARAKAGAMRLEAETARLNAGRVEVVEQSTFPSGKGVSLKAEAATNVGAPETPPDLIFRTKPPKAGRYRIRTHAAVDAKGEEAMRQAKSKTASLRLMIAVGDARPTSRVVFVPWSQPESCTQVTGKFDFTGEEQEIRVWLPEGVRLDFLQVEPYMPPRVPPAAADYQPPVVPPASRPRLWVNEQSLPQVRANLDKGENAPLWAKVKKQAAKPVELKIPPDGELRHNAALESAVVAKAFVHLMTGDKDRGREAVTLVRDYLAAVQFDNLLDITREIGRAIYTGSLVYDWCYGLMTPEERDSIRANLLRLAEDMEMGWPPFLQTIVNGHGNEAQLNRDLLAMAIAIYSEDPTPYRYCAYRVLEELAPMRKFEYQSPRHNQGISYGPFRFAWDLHAATLFRRMTGKPVFDPNIGDVYKFWLYMRLPTDRMLRDGDGFSDSRPASLGLAPLLVYAYTGDPIVKGDFLRQNGMTRDPIMVLLLNDPDLVPEPSLASLPLTLDFGPVLGGMIARTGWNLGPNRADVVVEMKGGGYHFGNHQHSDAGAFQIYYRGLQAVDLGQYHFYGTPYDMGFNKRSVAHSMMLAVDPDEQFRGTKANDGGTRFVQTCPTTPQRVTTDPMFANGQRVSSSFGPSPQRPFFSYFSVDLKSAYSSKIQEYVRTFCFLNLDNDETPAVLIVLDNMTTAKPEFKKYWQVNTLNPPEKTAEGVILRNSALELSGRVDVRMLRPKADERAMEILSGAAAYTVFGQSFTPPNPSAPEANGHRILFSPKTAQASDVFLTVLSMSDEQTPKLPVTLAETPATFTLALADRVVVLSRTGRLIEQPFSVDVPAGRSCQVLLAGLAPGNWSLRSEDGKVGFNARVEAGQNTAFVVAPGGRYSVQPKTIPGAAEYQAPPDFMPKLAAPLAN
jgi:heparin/heparan-sulfate lyase